VIGRVAEEAAKFRQWSKASTEVQKKREQTNQIFEVNTFGTLTPARSYE
jgi:hypothetical protein